jgi:hypothetical protein
MFPCQRIRHIRCDEGKPECEKCKAVKLKCDGYAPIVRGTRRKRSPKTTQPLETVAGNVGVVVSTPPVLLNSMGRMSLNDQEGDPLERRSFHHFRLRTSEDLSGNFYSNFWSRLVLQLSHNEPAIRHGLIALSAAYELFQDGRITDLTSDQLALRQYNRAIRLLRARMSDPGDRGAEVALICSVIFISIESVRGNFKAVSTHLKSGLGILQTWRASGQRYRSRANLTGEVPYLDPQTDEDELVELYARLDLTVTAFLSIPSSEIELKTPEERLHPEAYLPEAFYNLRQAQEASQKLENHSLYFLMSYYMYAGIPANKVPYKAKAEFRALLVSLHLWANKFETLMKRPDMQNLQGKDLQSACMLVIHQKTIYIMVKVLPYGEDLSHYDPFVEEFRSIVSLAETIVKLRIESAAKDLGSAVKPAADHIPRPLFTFDLGVVGPLFFVTYNCPDVTIRWQALSIMKASQLREGLWDSQAVAKVSESIMRYRDAGHEILEEFRGGLPHLAEMAMNFDGKGTSLSDSLRMTFPDLENLEPYVEPDIENSRETVQPWEEDSLPWG